MKQKHIAIIVLVVALLGASVYAMSNSKKSIEKPPVQGNTTKPTNTVDTSDWLTYRGEKYGYEIRYPKEADIEVHISDSGTSGLSWTSFKEYFQLPPDLVAEREQKQGKSSGSRIEIQIYGLTTEYASARAWYYENKELRTFVERIEPTCAQTEPREVPIDGYAEYCTTFAGEPAYARIMNTKGTVDGLYAVKSYDIVFFHNSRPWEVRYGGIPDHPTDKWKTHPYYPYLEKALPVTEAIINSFRFVDATSTVGVR